MNETPPQLGYRMPAEWARHDATVRAWPHNSEGWPRKVHDTPWS